MAHYTTNLNLYEKDPLVDGLDKFSVTTMMNENWDKIDAGVQKKLTAGENIIIANDTIHALNGLNTTVSELNLLHGLTASSAELNKLDGASVTTAEINILHGLTATTTELNYCDGVTSNIQDQINGIKTPSTDFKATLLELLYPKYSIYLTIDTSDTCPIQTQLGGTWELVSTDRVLQGASTVAGAGGTKAAGLPNISGGTAVEGAFFQNPSGCFYHGGAERLPETGNSWQDIHRLELNASRSSSIYGSSDTVQPPAYLVNVWKRTA